MTKLEEIPIAVLSATWTPLKGLYYPNTLKMANGEEIIIKNYTQHHRIIKKLFKPTIWQKLKRTI